MALYGDDDVINYDQRKSLPYTQSTILELLRCACVAPLSLPRVATRDITVLGYSIPRGTEIWVNEWAINRDRNVWNKPHDFNPARFLDDSGRVDPKLKESIISFGEGRSTRSINRRKRVELLFKKKTLVIILNKPKNEVQHSREFSSVSRPLY